MFTGSLPYALSCLVVILGRIIDVGSQTEWTRVDENCLCLIENRVASPVKHCLLPLNTPAHHVHVVVTAPLETCQRLAHTTASATSAISTSLIAELCLFAVPECGLDISRAHVDPQTGPRPFGSGAISRCLCRRGLRLLGHAHGRHRIGSVSPLTPLGAVCSDQPALLTNPVYSEALNVKLGHRRVSLVL